MSATLFDGERLTVLRWQRPCFQGRMSGSERVSLPPAGPYTARPQEGQAMPAHSTSAPVVSQETHIKTCARCKQPVPVTLFPVDRRNRDGLDSWCRPCRREWRRGRKEQDLAYQKRRRDEHPDRERERLKRWREANRDKCRAQSKRHHEKHRDARNAAARLRMKAYIAANPSAYYAAATARAIRRLERVNQNGGSFTAREWLDLKRKYGNRCLCCGAPEPQITLGPDHVVPVVLGGSSDISNIQPLCWPCNNRKRTRVIDYRPQQGCAKSQDH